jgi:rSAM/selenodomain-associated transferase 1
MLIIFTKYPEPGMTKTRLVPAIGAIAAADIQHRMSLRTFAIAKEFCREIGTEIEIRFTGGTAEQMAGKYGPELQYREQGVGDLGQRLTLAVNDAFLGGAREVVAIGSDCPGLSTIHLLAASEALLDTDVVLGPALDGGYYLIGLRQPHVELFNGIAWSTEHVLQQTLQIANRLGLAVHLLETLADIDRPEDLRHMPPD